jgi:hypothetical protein
MEKSEDQSGLNLKPEEDESEGENIEVEGSSDSEGSESGNSGSEDMKEEFFEEKES